MTSFYWMFRDCSNLTTVPNMGLWNTSAITSMEGMFYSAVQFNENISGWDTSKVTSMRRMFRDAFDFNQSINAWNVGNVTDMRELFYRAYDFNQDLSSWDTSKVTSLYYAFYGASSFNGNISTWNTANVTSLDYAFQLATSFNQDLSSWNTSNVTSMIGTFSGASSFNSNISSWDTSKVVSMFQMFAQATSFNQSIGNWDTGNVTTMAGMFSQASSFNQDLPWNVAKVNTMSDMFSNAWDFNGDISSWDVSNVTNMYHMFYMAYDFNQPIGSWNTDKVTTMDSMFWNSSFNHPIGNWNTSKVTTMYGMFRYASSFNQDVTGWDTGNVQSMYRMFNGVSPEFDYNLGSWNLTNVTTISTLLAYPISAQNYTATLIGWAAQDVKNNISVSFSTSKYTVDAIDARAHLTNSTIHNWSITDGGLIAKPNLSFVSPTTENGTHSQDYIYVNISASSAASAKNVSVYLYNSSGLVVTNSSNNSFVWSINDLNPGEYFLNASLIDTEGLTNITETRTINLSSGMGCGTLNSSDTIYNLSSDVSTNGACFNITAPNVTLDCAGHTISYSSQTDNNFSYGVYSNQFNTTVKNCIIYNFTVGVHFNDADNGMILNNTISSFTNLTIGLSEVDFASPASPGILLRANAENNLIDTNSVFSKYGSAIYLHASADNTIANTNATSNYSVGIHLYALNGAGGWRTIISNSSGHSSTIYGIYLHNIANTTILNSTGSSSGNTTNSIGIYLDSASLNRIINSTGNATCHGIHLFAQERGEVTGSRGITSSSSSACGGITFNYLTTNVNVTNSSGIATDAGTGIYYSPQLWDTNYYNRNIALRNSTAISNSGTGMVFSGVNNTVTGSVIRTTSGSALIAERANVSTITNSSMASSSGIGVFILNSNAVSFSRISINGSYGYYLSSSSSNNITDCGIINGTFNDVYVTNAVESTNNIFLNCSYDSESVNGAENILIKKWYYTAKAEYTNGTNINGAVINGTNRTGSQQFSDTTGFSGWIDRQEIIDYINIGGTRNSYNNYTFKATYSVYTLNTTHNISVDTNVVDTFTFPTNTPPGKVVLTYPGSENDTFIERVPTFVWQEPNDAEGDELTYQINVSTFANFTDTVFSKSYVDTTYQMYDLASPAEMGFDTYYWRVRAYDGIVYGEWSDVWNFTLVPSVSISMVVNNITFTMLYPNMTDSTINDEPMPLVLKSTSNTYVKISQMNISKSIWDSVALNTSYWQIRVRPNSDGSFNESGSRTTFFNASNVTELIRHLNYSSTRNNASIDINFTVPLFEPPGEKTALIYFEAEGES
jgi:surface protein/parallel beta-helix repeat protein